MTKRLRKKAKQIHNVGGFDHEPVVPGLERINRGHDLRAASKPAWLQRTPPNFRELQPKEREQLIWGE